MNLGKAYASLERSAYVSFGVECMVHYEWRMLHLGRVRMFHLGWGVWFILNGVCFIGTLKGHMFHMSLQNSCNEVQEKSKDYMLSLR